MDHAGPVRGHEGDVRLHAQARLELRERQKQELRRERDLIVLELARKLGADGLADSLGTSATTTETLLGRVRGRIALEPAEFAARRITRDPDRWREADRHYEALGRSVRLPAVPPRG
jgi:hypothetical protein